MVHLFFTHVHWDHIMGFPFFMPAYIPGNIINIYSCHPHVEEAFRRQHGAPSFPVPFDILGADIRFHIIEPEVELDGDGCVVAPTSPGIGFEGRDDLLERYLVTRETIRA